MTEPRPDQNVERPDFSELAERAAELRLAGDLDGAETLYQEIAERDDVRARGYGLQHLGLCVRARAEMVQGAGDAENAEALFCKAAANFARAALQYEQTHDFVRASAARLDLGVLYLRQGDAELAVTEIGDSITYLLEYASTEPDQGFVDEHRGIKFARLAEAYLALGDIEGARQAIAEANRKPQRNEYFAMVTIGIQGRIHAVEDNALLAGECFTMALEQAERFGDVAKRQEYRERIKDLA